MARERSDKSKSKSPKKEERRAAKPDEGMSTSPESAEWATSGDSVQQASLQSLGRSTKRQVRQRTEEERTADARESEPFSEQRPSTLSTTDGHQHIEDDSAHRRIAERAFSLFQERGYEHGNDWAHWFEAERQIKNTRV